MQRIFQVRISTAPIDFELCQKRKVHTNRLSRRVGQSQLCGTPWSHSSRTSPLLKACTICILRQCVHICIWYATILMEFPTWMDIAVSLMHMRVSSCVPTDPVAPRDVVGRPLTAQQKQRSLMVWLEGSSDASGRVLNYFQVRYSISACCTTGAP